MNKDKRDFVEAMLDDISIFEKSNNCTDMLAYMYVYKSLHEVLASSCPDDVIHQLTEKTMKANYLSGECYLYEERAVAVKDILENGIRKARTPGLFPVSHNSVVDFLLELDEETFTALVDTLCAENQEFYASEKTDEEEIETMREINDAICMFYAQHCSTEEMVGNAASWFMEEFDGEMEPHEAVMFADRIWKRAPDFQNGTTAIERKNAVLDILYDGIDAGRSIPNKIPPVFAHELLLAADDKTFDSLLAVAADPNLILPDNEFWAVDNLIRSFNVGTSDSNGTFGWVESKPRRPWQTMSATMAGNLMRSLCPRHGISTDGHRDRIGEIIVNASDTGCGLDVAERFDTVYWILNQGAYDGHVMKQSIPDILAAEFLCQAEDEVVDTLLDVVASYHACPTSDTYTPTPEYQARLDALNNAIEAFFQWKQKHLEF